MKIKDLCCDEQPREKMLRKGPSSLSNAELLAILIRTGDGTSNAVELSRGLLLRADQSLCDLSSWSVDRLMSEVGIGPVKALTISAAFELGRRWFGENSGRGRCRITDSELAYKAVFPTLKSLKHEECWALYLNRASELCAMERISTGSLTQTTMDCRSIVMRAMEKHSSALILAHNHPSGNPRPGRADIESTANLRAALKNFDISLLDHLVVCDECWYSFADEEVHRIDKPAGED